MRKAPPATCDSAVSPGFHGCPAFLHRYFPPQSPSSPPLDPSLHSQSIAALTLGLFHNPSIPAPSHCAFQEISIPVRGKYGCSKDCLILIPFRLPQISCFTLSLKCFSSDSDNCPDVGIGPLLQFPHPPRAGPVLLTPLFFPLLPSSYFGSIYYFPLVRYSCLLSAGVLDALLCLKMYSSCIRGKRCTPRSPTPLPSCSLFKI